MNRFGTDLVKRLSIIGERRSPLEAFRTFVNLSACCVAVGTRESEYLEEIKRWDAESIKGFQECFGMLVMAMEDEPYRDLMGPIYMDLGATSSKNWNGEFYTPQELCDMMAKLNVGGFTIPDDRPLEVLEPACGAGAMVLSVAKELKSKDTRHSI